MSNNNSLLGIIHSDLKVKDMMISRRGCVRHDENVEVLKNERGIEMEVFKNYSRTTCLLECRARHLGQKGSIQELQNKLKQFFLCDAHKTYYQQKNRFIVDGYLREEEQYLDANIIPVVLKQMIKKYTPIVL